jgi:leucyl aminopeptidase
MIEFTAAGPVEDSDADAVVVPVFADRAWGPGAEAVAARLGDHLEGQFDAEEFKGKSGQAVAVTAGPDVSWSRVIFVGLGEAPEAEDIRRAAGVAGRLAARFATVATSLHEVEVADSVAAVASGFVLGQYRFDKYRSEPKPSQTERMLFANADDDDIEAAMRGAIVAESVSLARDLVNEPPVHKSPEYLAGVATDLAGEHGLRVRIYDEEEIRSERLGGLAAVAAGSHQPPRLVEMWHEPEAATAFLAVVGKGIVFDSGGLSLKPANAMEDMKTDMSGGAAVLGAMAAIARLELGVKVVGIVPFTENMPGGGAQRPGDVITIRNGKTIEVLNTDAEGRLVLADGLSLAAELEPDLIVDLATLTGACVIALGDEIAGLFGNEEEASSKVLAAAARAGERVWAMPLPDDYRKKIDSDIADMKNTGPRYGGAITAAHLLREFVDDRPWVHLDIAGPARAKSEDGYITKGGTGFGVRTIVALAEDMAAR